MWRVLFFLLIIAGLAFGLARFADEPGSLVIDWLGYRIETSVFATSLALLLALVALVLLWSLLRYLIARPAAITRFWRGRREKRGLEALNRGLIAVGAGDETEAQRYASAARRALPHEPLTAILRAQTAQLRDDRAEARRIFTAMIESPDTELYGLHGLYQEASREGESEAARQFAERAMRRDPKLAWSVKALFEIQCREGDWEGALETLEVARRHGQIDRATAKRRRAVLLAAQAMAAEESDIDRARDLALEAHKLAPDLVPAADIAGRMVATKGSMSRAARIIAKTWRLSPNPQLAQAYAFLRPGDSPRDRLKRVRMLAKSTPDSIEGPIAIAHAAIDAHDWDAARAALAPYLEDRPTARICLLMARIEAGEHRDEGRVREWLARALRGARDPAWTADGVVSDRWAPISPVTGRLDAFEWKVPVEMVEHAAAAEALERLSREEEPTLTLEPAPPVTAPAAEDAAEAASLPEPAQEIPIEPVEEEARPVPASVTMPPPPPILDGGKAPPLERPAPSPVSSPAPQAEPVPQAKPRHRVPAGSAPMHASEPRIFVPPRAPDDPGPPREDGEDEVEGAGLLGQRRP